MSRASKKKKKRKKKHQNERMLLQEKIERQEWAVASAKLDLAEAKKGNIKAFHIRNLKVFLGTCNLLLPFVVVGSLSVGSFRLFDGGLPFYRDDITKCKKYELECDTDNNIDMNTKYVTDGFLGATIPTSSLELHTEVEEDDDSYIRYKREYDISNADFADLSEAILKGDYDYIVENYKDYDEEKQVFNDINSTKKEAFIEASLYKLDDDDTISVPESKRKNMIITFAELGITLTLGAFFAIKRDYDYKEDLEDIFDSYNRDCTSLKPLEEKLRKSQEKLLVLTNKRKGNSNDRR